MNYTNVLDSLKEYFSMYGLEVYGFKIKWYNEILPQSLHLNYSDDTAAYVIISTPSMFEKCFIPFLQKKKNKDSSSSPRDPIDECLSYHFTKAMEIFPDHEVFVLKDYETYPNRKPKVLVQTAAHVAGAAYYYQRSDVDKCHSEDGTNSNLKASSEINGCGDVCLPPWPKEKKIFGVCIHPKYGGWFAIRGVMIFPQIEVLNTSKPLPPDCVPSQAARIELLNRFNGNWQDWSYRDIIPVSERYSDNQKLYFSTIPKHRHAIIEQLLAEPNHKNDSH